MKKIILAAVVYFVPQTSVFVSAQSKTKADIEIVSTFTDERPSNIAISPEGRIFVTMSAEGKTEFLVREILPDGKIINFPDEEWIKRPVGNSIKGINSAIGIQVSSDNILWVLDMGNASANPKQAPKLIGWDIKSRKLVHVYPLPDAVLRPSSFLQDFVIDEKHHTAVIADMTMGGMILPATPAFVVVDLKTGYSRRVLENHTSFQPVDEPVIVNGRALSHQFADGKKYEPRYPLNPISIDPERNWIYYGALGGEKIYRIEADAVANEELQSTDLEKRVEYYAPKPKSDGFKVGSHGQIYVTDVEHNAIGVSTPGKYTILAQDNTLFSWPDGVAISLNGYVYVVSDQLQNKPWWNNNQNVSKPPYYVLRIKIQ
ncbi:L-dopachrome tautomerase-related protein [Chryseobacterium tongliaoense]|uniref:L-dopachrome tautomerase-related protein n=1 Tax=Chryseobacterium tongliaoense TaxID=3240933 RepID=UPI003517E474